MMASRMLEVDTERSACEKQSPKNVIIENGSAFNWHVNHIEDDSGYITTPDSLQSSSSIGTSSGCSLHKSRSNSYPSLKRSANVQVHKDASSCTPALALEDLQEDKYLKKDSECTSLFLCPGKKFAKDIPRKTLDLSAVSGSDESLDAPKYAVPTTVPDYFSKKYCVLNNKSIRRSESASQLLFKSEDRHVRSYDEASTSGCLSSLEFSSPVSVKTKDVSSFMEPRRNSLPYAKVCRRSLLHSTPRRSLEGRDHVDFISYLGDRSTYWPAVSRILKFLDGDDLRRICLVSKIWCRICKMDKEANERRSKFVKQLCENKENNELFVFQKNFTAKVVPDLPVHRRRSTLTQLNNYQQESSESDTSPQPQCTVSPTKARFQCFLQEGQKLENGERLEQCPRCTYPSHVAESTSSGRCTRRSCSFEFCIRCRCELHDKRPCSVSVPGRSRKGSVGSKQSRRNLRRL